MPQAHRPLRPGPHPAPRRPAFRPALECLEDRLAPARFAVIGDYGLASDAEQHVANLVHSWGPDGVLTVGDNNYPTGQASTIDANVGQYYHDFIYPYTGGYGAGSPTGANQFFPTLGDHDWGDAYPDPSGDQPHLDYFSLPGNERYYTFTSGPVQFFALDSDANEPDGNSSTSAQAQWLQSQLAASTATWKVVYFHETPYSSAAAEMANPMMRWPFQAWGASAVLAGHDHAYERLIEDNNFPYFVDGLGGNGHDSGFGNPVPGSQLRYAGDYGAMLIDAQADHVTFQLVGAWDHAGQVIDSYTLYAQPAAHVPDAPSGLTAAAVSASQVKLAWTDNSSNEDGFKIEQSLDGIVFTQVGTAGRNALSASVTGLLPGVNYTFRVRATNAAGDSAATNTASATTPSLLAPAAPSNLVATTVNAFRIDLSWKDNSTLLPPEDGFKLYRSADGVNWTWFATTSTGVTSLSWTAANPASVYYFQVTAYNALAESAPTNTAVAPTPPAGAPATPSNLAATAVTGSRVDLSWQDNSDNEDGFKLYRSTDGVTWEYIAVTGENVTAYTWWAASPGATYSFQIRSYNAAGNSLPSNTASVTTPAAPPAPSNLAAAAVSASQVNLTWADNSTNEDGFRLYRSTDGVNWAWFASAGANATAYTWWGASPGTAYSFYVTATNAAGESAASNTATATTPAPPAAPGNLAATAVTGSRVDLSWTNNATNQTGFKVYESTDGVHFTWIASVGADVTAYTWWGASPGTSYSFYVTATNAVGDSAPSNTATVTTPAPPAAPSNLTATAVSGSQVNLTWADNASNEDGFRLYYSTDGVNWVWFATADANATAYTWWGASPGTTYYFRVSAYNAIGESDPSNTATATTPS